MKSIITILLAAFFGFLLTACNNSTGKQQQHENHTAKDVLYTCPMPQDSFFSNKPGVCPKCGMDLVKVEDHSGHEDQQPAAQYTCPMHPEIVKDQPGECPICGMGLVKKEPEAPAISGIELESLLKPSNELVIASVPVTAISKEQIVAEVNALGTVEYDTRLTGNISAKISGRIEKLYVKYKFQWIRKGQKIMDIYSPELMTAQQNLLFLQKNDPANQSLLQASRQRLYFLGMTPGQVDHILKTGKPVYSVSVYSNLSGHVHDAVSSNEMKSGGSSSMVNFNPVSEILGLKEGMYVQKGQTLFNIYNPSQARALLNIYSDGQSLIKKGQLVKITPEAAPSKSFQGRIDFIEPFFREGIRTTTVRVYFDNSKLHLPIGSQVKGLVIAHPATAYWLPKESVLSLGMDRIVFLKVKDGFQARRISAGLTSNNKVQVLSGLSERDSVALNAQYLTDSESFIKIKDK